MDDGTLNAAGGIGAYRWGSLLLETSTLAPASGKIIGDALTGASLGVLVTDSKAHQRATIAVLHELVHLQQDLATGLGAWDHVADRVAYQRLVVQSRWYITEYTEPPYAEVVKQMLDERGSSGVANQVRGDLDAIRNRTIGLRQLTGGDWATPEVAAVLQRVLNASVADAGVRSLRTMFEGEAACVVDHHISRSRFGGAGLEWIEEHRNFWDVTQMGGDYVDSLIDVATVMLNHHPSAEEMIESMPSLLVLVPWVVDLASAYPPPSLLEEWQGDPAGFDPVLRYLLILRALNRLDVDRKQRLLAAVLAEHWNDAEAVLRDASELPYPSSAEIYERWLTVLNPLATSDDWDAPLFEMRTTALRARLEGVMPKGIGAMLADATPVWVMVTGIGFKGILQGKQILDASVVNAMLGRRAAMELFDLFHGNGRFRCPWGRANRCAARQEECSTGITLVGLFSHRLPGQGRVGRNGVRDMTADWLDAETTLTAEYIRQEVALDSAADESDADKSLKLTGLEPIIIMLAVKAVTGIASGFAGRGSYDLWKKARTKKQLDELRASLRFDVVAAGVEPVDEATIRHDLIDSFVDEGLTAGQARKVVDGALQRIRTRVQT